MRPVDFSWRYALRGWLGALGLGVLLTAACAILSAVLASAASDSATSLFAGLGYALLSLVGSFPLRSLMGHAAWGDPHLWRLIVPNFALLGLAPGVAFGFIGKPRGTSLPVDRRPYFRMDDGRD